MYFIMTLYFKLGYGPENFPPSLLRANKAGFFRRDAVLKSLISENNNTKGFQYNKSAERDNVAKNYIRLNSNEEVIKHLVNDLSEKDHFKNDSNKILWCDYIISKLSQQDSSYNDLDTAVSSVFEVLPRGSSVIVLFQEEIETFKELTAQKRV